LDRIEYQEKMKQIRQFAEEEKYTQAAAIIEEINWKRVRSATSLCFVGTVLGRAGKFKEGKELLLMAYDRSPIGRSIIYELSELCIREGNLDEAEEYYKEFVEVAPRDSKRYELRYAIDKARGASADALISVLESLKERDFSERWSYELAQMYYKAGRAEKCIALCDEIILWFGDGEYVERALELKMKYQALTGHQKKLYEDIRMRKAGYVKVAPEDVRSSGEILHGEVTIPTIQTDINRFNTMNLQQELAKSMQQIIDATEQETIRSTMDDVRKKVAESQIPVLESFETPEHLYENIETEEEIDSSLQENFQTVLAEENDGQMSLFGEEDGSGEDRQITGQLCIDDILAEWAKTSRAYEEVMEDNEKRRLESAKQRALVETGSLMDVLAKVQEENEELERITMGEGLGSTAANVSNIMETMAPGANAIPDEIIDAVDTTDGKPPEGEILESEDEPSIAEVFATQRRAEEMQREKAHKWDTMSLEFLSKEEKEIFSYFIPVNGMEKQICAVLQGVKGRKLDSTSKAGNVMIEGAVRSGKTVLATDLIKVLQTNDPDNVAKVGRISGDKLNTKDPANIVHAVKGGYLIIERAGKMNEETAHRLNEALSGDTDNLLVFIEDTRKGLMEMAGKCVSLAEKFTEHIQIPIFTIDEMVNFGKSYAKEQGYGFDQMSVLALYKCIANIRSNDDVNTTLVEVMEIVNQAIESSKKHKLAKKLDDENLILLKEKDFPL